MTSTPRRSPSAIPTPGTPTALVSMGTESAEALEAKAALHQVIADIKFFKITFEITKVVTSRMNKQKQMCTFVC